jgi:hypothetical protein
LENPETEKYSMGSLLLYPGNRENPNSSLNFFSEKQRILCFFILETEKIQIVLLIFLPRSREFQKLL